MKPEPPLNVGFSSATLKLLTVQYRTGDLSGEAFAALSAGVGILLLIRLFQLLDTIFNLILSTGNGTA